MTDYNLILNKLHKMWINNNDENPFTIYNRGMKIIHHFGTSTLHFEEYQELLNYNSNLFKWYADKMPYEKIVKFFLKKY